MESASDASRLQRVLSKESNIHLGCLKFPNGSNTQSTEEVHFQSFHRSLQGSGKQQWPRDKYKPWAWGLAPELDYPCGEEWAITTSEPYKAPGTDGIYPTLVQEGLGILLGP